MNEISFLSQLQGRNFSLWYTSCNTNLYEKLCQHAKFEGRRYLLCHGQLLQWVSMLLLAHQSRHPEYEGTYKNQGSKPTNISLTQNFNLLQIMPNPS